MEKLNEGLKKFIDGTPNAFYCVDNIKKELISNGFIELNENESWDHLEANNNYFVIRNDSSIIAFKLPDQKENIGFNIVTSHGDSPSYKIKNNPEMFDGNYLKLNTSKYGSMIHYSWLDRPLSLSGRVITYSDGRFNKELVNIDKDLLIIPSQALHINLEANTKNELNPQTDMLPVISLNADFSLDNTLKENLEAKGSKFERICDYDLYLYNRDKLIDAGLNDEFIMALRLDDLASVYPSLHAFINSNNTDSINVMTVFNNEEIGNLTQQGADSTFLSDILERISIQLNLDKYKTYSNSFMISADNAHAIHPSGAYKSDPTNKVRLNNGIVIKHHINYTTDAVSSSLFKELCKRANSLYQDFECKSDMRCGSTLGNISLSHVSIDSIDVGIPQLSMHSANETMGSKDLYYMYNSLLEFYNTSIRKSNNSIMLTKKI